MSHTETYFPSFEALSNHLQSLGKGHLNIAHRHCKGYAGMVLDIGMIFDARLAKYELDLEWMALGLDLFGENLMENYLYQFESLEKLVEYLQEKYHIGVTNIPTNHRFDEDAFPNPLKNADQKPVFEEAWARFQKDFRAGIFLDPSLKLIYSTEDL